MSNELFPTFYGIKFEMTTTPEYRTVNQRSLSGVEVRIGFMDSPLKTFQLNLEFLYEAFKTNGVGEWRQFESFFMARHGMLDNFLFSNRNDNTATAEVFATGNGVTLAFDLTRAFGQVVEKVHNPVAAGLTIYKTVAGVRTLATGWTLGANGRITFAVAPVAGAALDWTGTFLYRVRFNSDKLPVVNKFKDLHEVGAIELVGSLRNIL